ncbi:hypothetical protein MUP29_09035 [bacterium]|nr:hypothetical protein [bacterium]
MQKIERRREPSTGRSSDHNLGVTQGRLGDLTKEQRTSLSSRLPTVAFLSAIASATEEAIPVSIIAKSAVSRRGAEFAEEGFNLGERTVPIKAMFFTTACHGVVLILSKDEDGSSRAVDHAK